MSTTTATEKRTLRYDFTAVEVHDLSLQLAKKNKEVQSLEDEKKSVTSSFQAKINEAKASINMIADQVTNGWEYRPIECDILYHEPTQGKKTIVRKDSNQVVGTEAMTEYEWNLFNQPENGTETDEPLEDAQDAEFEVQEEGGPRLLSNGDED